MFASLAAGVAHPPDSLATRRDSFVLPDGRRVHAEEGGSLVIRKSILALSLLALPIATVVAAGTTANAAVRPHKAVTFTGKVSCSVTGSISASPPLTFTAHTTTISIAGKATKCTGSTKQGGVTLKSGAISGKVVAKNTSCTSLESGVPSPKGTIKWTGTGGTVAPTAFTLSDGAATFGSSTTTITFTSTQTGSFKGKGASSSTIDKTESQLISECEGSGISKLVIASGTIS
jgi:hypothetical protein